MFKWNDVKSNPHPAHENPVLLSIVHGNNGVAEKTVTAGTYDSSYDCWDFSDEYLVYDEAIVVAWAEFPKPYDGKD